MKSVILNIRVKPEARDSVNEILDKKGLTIAVIVRVLMSKILSEDSIDFLFASKDIQMNSAEYLLHEVHAPHPNPEICEACKYLGRNK